ncbi:MAG: sugar phosphate isomerase/epimerase [Caldilineales bacterium]
MTRITRAAQLALSTMWMQHRFQRVVEFAAAARALGFGGIEVSHIVTPAMLDDADPATLGIRSVHFPAPLRPSPFGAAAETLLSSSDDAARAWAVAQGRGSIDLAVSAGATAVCLHLGEVPAPHHLEWALMQRYLGGQGGSPAYAAALAEVEAARWQVTGPAFEAARRSLAELAAYAAPRGIRLGVESRTNHWQIPAFAELGMLLEENDPAVVGFWYDCGHVQLLDNLGFHRHYDWLTAYATRIVGVHLHDVRGLRDHLLPGLGELNFPTLLAAVPDEAMLTCELDWYYSAAELARGLRHLLGPEG